VLVSLAVIFLPMILDSPSDDISITDTNVPRRSDRLRQMDQVLPEGGDLIVEPPAAGPSQPRITPPVPAATRPTPVEVKPKPRMNPKSAEARPKPRPRPKAIVRPPPKKGPVPTSWIIQVASLKDPERARALVKKIKAKKYPAYVQRAKVKGRYVYRVRVGPELDRKRIEKMAARLDKAFKIKTTIQRHY